ncbi:SDR family NAD(P)-dependent oxidoreductase [Chitinivorax sp. PXF-14]|uniref:SDR family NAD(P)-dependent oxidoreductase n=1 Tax=Chitinivorax sp. PXF-14 TaxID=3230488 RepID=UPI003465977F
MQYDLNGKVVLITGAAGGIGAATARELYALGANLVLTDMQQAAVDKLAAEFDPSRVLPMTLDVTDAIATKAVVQNAVERFGRLDVVHANAGISWRDGASTVASCDEAEFEKIIEVDLLGVWRTVRAALPEVVRNKGQILVTSSIYSFFNGMANAPYAASKAGVEMLARCLRAEIAYTGATASVVYPGWTATPIAKVAFGGNAIVTRMNEVGVPAWLRQPISPEHMARAIAKGVQRRRPRIFAPLRWVPFSLSRGIFNLITDAMVVRHEKLQGLIQQLEAESRHTQKQHDSRKPR